MTGQEWHTGRSEQTQVFQDDEGKQQGQRACLDDDGLVETPVGKFRLENKCESKRASNQDKQEDPQDVVGESRNGGGVFPPRRDANHGENQDNCRCGVQKTIRHLAGPSSKGRKKEARQGLGNNDGAQGLPEETEAPRSGVQAGMVRHVLKRRNKDGQSKEGNPRHAHG